MRSNWNTFNDSTNRHLSYSDNSDISSLCLERQIDSDSNAAMTANDSNFGRFATQGTLAMQHSRETSWHLNDEDPFSVTVDEDTYTDRERQNGVPPYSGDFSDKAIYSPSPAPRPVVTKRWSPQRTEQTHCFPSNPHHQQRNLHKDHSSTSPLCDNLSVGAETENLDEWQRTFQDLGVDFQGDEAQGDVRTKNPSEQPNFGLQSEMITSAIKAASTMGFPVTTPVYNNNHQRDVARPWVSTDQAADFLAGMHMDEYSQANDIHGHKEQQPQGPNQFLNKNLALPSDWVIDPQNSAHSSNQSQVGIWDSQIDAMHNSLPLEDWWLSQEHDSQLFAGNSQPGKYPRLVHSEPQGAGRCDFEQDDRLIPQSYGGQYPAASEIGCAITTDVQPVCPPSFADHMFTGDDMDMLAFYPRVPPPIPATNELTFTTPRRRMRRRSGYVRSTSSSSPTLDAHSNIARTPSRRELRSRKSIQRLGPRRDASCGVETPRHRSTSRPPRTPKTPKTASGAGFQRMDFVNFTPKDANKLLSDVAPSGSSKTRARREQEAREKSKKLNEAALLAVKKNGGDVEAFRRELLRKGEVQIA